MGIKHSTVTVGTSETSLLTGVTDDDAAPVNVGRRSILVTAATPVYLGGPGVTSTSYGYLLPAGGEMALDLGVGDVLYAVVASGTADVHILHSGV